MIRNIQITIMDDGWPKLKCTIVRDQKNVRALTPAYFDIANSQFEPAVRDALRLSVEEIIQTRRPK